MIETTSEGGKFKEGILSCDNKECHKVLYKWSNERYAPPEERIAYFAYSIRTRFMFMKQPPTNEMVKALKIGLVFGSQEQFAGYIFDFDVMPMMLDFCSSDCMHTWLSVNQGYGIVLHGNTTWPQTTFIADRPDRFGTFIVSNFQITTNLPNNAQPVSIPQYEDIHLQGEYFPIQTASALRPGETRPARGISMTTALLKCPMVWVDNSYQMQICNQLVQIGVDIIPSLWICPKCHGIIILDEPFADKKHQQADLRKEIETGRRRIMLNYYTNNNFDWGNAEFFRWLVRVIDCQLYNFSAYYEDAQFKALNNNVFLMNTFIDLEHVETIFGHLISP